jgi:uncharacterized protein (DUF1697 family)
MSVYIALLRGINVSGQKTIKMEALRAVFEANNFKNVRTYLQSGNVVFDAQAMDAQELALRISSMIQQTFGFDVPVIVLLQQNLEAIVRNNPFTAVETLAFLHCTFLAETPFPVPEAQLTEKLTAEEQIAFGHQAIYLFCPNGYGQTKLSNNFIERKLKVTATTRNWKTTMALLQMARG